MTIERAIQIVLLLGLTAFLVMLLLHLAQVWF
jgi:hypothetical protein